MRMIVSHRHRFIFLKTQKTAGTSIELALSRHCGPDDVITPLPPEDERQRTGRGAQNTVIPPERRRRGWRIRQALGFKPSKAGTEFYEHMSAAEARAALGPEVFDAYTKLVVVRNPWDREVSLYFWACRGMDELPPFPDFVRRRRTRPDRKTSSIYMIDGRLVADVVIRYETLAEDLDRALQPLGIPPLDLPRAKGSYRSPGSLEYRKLYTPETVEIVRRRNAREIALFGYAF